MNEKHFSIWKCLCRRPARWLIAIMLGLSVAGLQAGDPPELKIENSPVDRDGGRATSYAPVVRTIAPSVVSIYSEQMINLGRGDNPLMNDPFLRRFFGDNPPRQMPQRGLGSGIIMTEDGYILTNNHVVEGADKIMVVTRDKKQEFEATIVASDPQTDIAVLKVDGDNLEAATFGDSEHIQVGDVVFAVGNPMGVGQTVSMGIISALGRGTGILGRGGYENFIQTDAAINQGNSGGPLVDVEGRVIGINQSIASGGGGSDGIGFAVPVNLARNVAEQLITSGSVSRGYIGVSIQTLSPDLAQAFEIDDGSGALVSEVVPDSPGDKAGLSPGDVIVQYAGRKVRDSAHLRLMASQTAPGTEVDLKLVREGKGRSVDVTLGELPSDLTGLYKAGKEQGSSGRDGLDGVVVDDLTRDARRQLDIPRRITGGLVTEVDPASNAHAAGLREGDVITEVNHRAMNGADDVVRASGQARGDKILLRVWSQRGGSPGLIFVVVDNTSDG